MSLTWQNSKKRIFLAAKLLVLLIVGWFIYGTIAKAWQEIDNQTANLNAAHFDAAWLAVSGLFYALGLVPAGLFWFLVLKVLGQETRVGETLRAYCIGHLGKYAPGKAMVVVLRTGLVRGERVNTSVAAASVFYETLTMMAVGACMAGGILALKVNNGRLGETGMLGAVPHSLVFLGTIGMIVASGLPIIPPVFRFLSQLAGVGRSDLAVREKLRGLGYGTLGLGWIAMVLSWLCLGASLWATLRAIGIDGLDLWSRLDEYTAVVALAVVAGFITMIPAGLGSRDAIIIALVMQLFAVSNAQAFVAAALLRLVWLVTELVVSGVLYLGMLRTRRCDVPSHC